jgi:hypothetical protein
MKLTREDNRFLHALKVAAVEDDMGGAVVPALQVALETAAQLERSRIQARIAIDLANQAATAAERWRALAGFCLAVAVAEFGGLAWWAIAEWR